LKSETLNFTDSDDWTIYAYRWLPEGEPRGIVNLVHGMAEHATRYERLAKALTDKGFALYAHDLRGHGKTAGSLENAGYLGAGNGFEAVVRDARMVSGIIAADFPGKPLFVMGHSLGSFIVQRYIQEYGKEISGAVLSGTNGKADPLLPVAAFIARIIILFRGTSRPSPLLTKMSFGQYNKPFAPNRTAFDWLSRDAAEVDKYVNDPYCGFECSASFFLTLTKGLRKIGKTKNRKRVPHDLPIYLFAGSKDPVGLEGKGFLALASAYRELGISDIEYNLYEGGRHEILNEINRDEATQDLVNWLEKHLA
jgi:alpha-beta hydrolase superfamily lysophospholipase